ncbi:hypothetical protein SCOR_29330 [Sulfidibacter corallicola]|uniref:Uncharacterized protein n=1 Tax=Sulfidibacter corallicola TaxID=2818388 RepID=A0A8A4TN73_SULCO|nr:hypothetical protein [Sulfidibacter corallicola]QTD50341.1 hypothetical protein J3U87_32555 [Sulfidibacter corallicola]
MTRMDERRLPGEAGCPSGRHRLRVLVVMDAAFSLDDDFLGLGTLRQTLADNPECWVGFDVCWARRGQGLEPDAPGYTFTDEHLAPFRVVLLFGYDSDPPLDPLERGVLARWMQAGGGLFACGDHGRIGAALCGDLPRLRHMQRWKDPLPNSFQTRNDSTVGEATYFLDPFSEMRQLDARPARLAVRRYRAYHLTCPLEEADIASKFAFMKDLPHLVHPIFDDGHPACATPVLPDHAHEGEVVPFDPKRHAPLLDGTYQHPGPDGDPTTIEEFPVGRRLRRPGWEVIAAAPNQAAPRLIDQTPHEAVRPREFGVVGVYNGALTEIGVGRIAVDASFHHWVDGNLAGFAPHRGTRHLGDAAPADQGEVLARIRAYFRNLVTWLAPWSDQSAMAALMLWHARTHPALTEWIPDTDDGDSWRWGRLVVRRMAPLLGETRLRASWIHFLPRTEALALLDDRGYALAHLAILDEYVLGGIFLAFWNYQRDRDPERELDVTELVRRARRAVHAAMGLFLGEYAVRAGESLVRLIEAVEASRHS